MGKKTRPSEIKTPPIFSRFESNIVTVATGGLAFICTVAILVLCIKHFRYTITSIQLRIGESASTSSRSIPFSRKTANKNN